MGGRQPVGNHSKRQLSVPFFGPCVSAWSYPTTTAPMRSRRSMPKSRSAFIVSSSSCGVAPALAIWAAAHARSAVSNTTTSDTNPPLGSSTVATTSTASDHSKASSTAVSVGAPTAKSVTAPMWPSLARNTDVKRVVLLTPPIDVVSQISPSALV